MKLFKKNYKDLTDESLMDKFKRGESSAFDELYERYSKKLMYYFFKMLNQDKEKAQDFVHDVFLKIIQKPELFDVNKKFSVWIYRIAYNKCIDEYKQTATRKNEYNDFEEIEGLTTDLEFRIDYKIFENVLQNELGKLSSDHRTAFILKYKENYNVKEIADILNCPEGTIKSRLFYSLKKITKKLSDYNPIMES
jgi:RNA polymerase sigma-70 factor (ECF subfamily)